MYKYTHSEYTCICILTDYYVQFYTSKNYNFNSIIKFDLKYNNFTGVLNALPLKYEYYVFIKYINICIHLNHKHY